MVGRVTILDDAKPGMNPDIRPQDDLFGHVTGRWLDTAEIPADRSSWGPFVKLADESEQRVRAIIEEVAERPVEPGSPEQKIGDLYASFMDEARAEELGAEPIAPALAAVDAVATHRDLAQFLGELERAGGTGLFGSYVDMDSRNSDRYVVNLVQGPHHCRVHCRVGSLAKPGDVVGTNIHQRIRIRQDGP